MTTIKSNLSKTKRAHRVRSKVLSRSDLPRLIVKRSLNHLHTQIVDGSGKVLAAASSTSLSDVKGTKTELAKAVGVKLATEAKKAKVESVVLDRGQYRFHGRVKAMVESLKENGIKL